MSLLMDIASRATCGVIGGAMGLALGRFPRVVRIETTNCCNAQCVICPHRSMKRAKEIMSEGLFTRLVDESAASGCREVHLHNFGEPLLDPRLADRVRYVKSKGVPKVKIFSNGSLADEGRGRSLIEAGLDEIKISFDGSTREEFEAIRTPLAFDQVVENVHRLVAMRNEMKSPMKITINCCSTSDQAGTMRALEKVVDGFSFDKVHNWATEEVDQNASPTGRVRKPCSRLWRTFTVLANGDVALCCLDYDGKHLLGRIDANTSMADVWASQAYRTVRRQHARGRQGELELCRTCSKSFL
jgi:hypothetical protein